VEFEGKFFPIRGGWWRFGRDLNNPSKLLKCASHSYSNSTKLDN